MELNDNNVDLFRQQVNQFSELDKLIEDVKKQMKPYQQRLKELKNQRKEKEQTICNTMSVNNTEQLELRDGSTLEYQVKKKMVPVTQKTLKEKMKDFFSEGPGSKLDFNSKNSEQKGTELFLYIYGKQNRAYTETEAIKRKNPAA